MPDFAEEPDPRAPPAPWLAGEFRVLLFLSFAGLLFGVGLRRGETEALASDRCAGADMGFAVFDGVRRIEGDGPYEAQLYWPTQAVLGTSFPTTLIVREDDSDPRPVTLELEPESEP
jgi:hypothetical protein